MSVAATPTADRSPYRGYRFPPEIISRAVWLYFRFRLSFRDVQDLLAGAASSSATNRSASVVRQIRCNLRGWLRRRRGRAGDKWHLDEVLLKIGR